MNIAFALFSLFWFGFVYFWVRMRRKIRAQRDLAIDHDWDDLTELFEKLHYSSGIWMFLCFATGVACVALSLWLSFASEPSP